MLRLWAERLGHEVVKVYADTASGARRDRASLARAHWREFDVLLIWSLDPVEDLVDELFDEEVGYRPGDCRGPISPAGKRVA